MQNIFYVLAVINPFPTINTNPGGDTLTQKILPLVFNIAAALAIVFVAYGGFKYVISRGDPQATARAKDTILYAIIGLVVAILANVIVTFVIKRVSP
jgi:hypothetical protein